MPVCLGNPRPVTSFGRYCAVRNIGDSPPGTAQSGGESEEGRRPAPLGRVPAPQAWVRGEGRALAARLVRVRGPSLRTKQRGRTCSQYSALLSKWPHKARGGGQSPVSGRGSTLVLLAEITVTYSSWRYMSTGHSAPRHTPPEPGRDGALRHPWCRRAGPAPTGRGRGLGPSAPRPRPTARPGSTGRAGEPRVRHVRVSCPSRSPLRIEGEGAGTNVTVLEAGCT